MEKAERHTVNKPKIVLTMKKVICLIASAIVFVHAEAQYTNNKSVSDFNAIEVSAATHVKLMQGDTNYVSLSSKDSNTKMPKMEVVGGVLKINSSFHNGQIVVHVKNIKSIKVNEAARVTCLDTLVAHNLTIHVSDAGKAVILVHAKNIYVRGADASNIVLAGTADSMELKATDASHIVADELKTLVSQVRSADGSEADVWSINSIDANATDGSSIHIKGTPTRKNTSASDGGSVTMDATGEEIVPREDAIVELDTAKNGKKKLVITGDAFIGGGFVTGGTQAGAPVKYGASREFIMGFGWEKKIVKWDGIGADLYYKSTDFYLSEDSAKTFPNKVLHQQEKISVQNFGGLLYDRIHFSRKLFLDGGIYGDWAIHSKYITWDANTPGAESTKIIQRNLGFVNPLDYGLTFRFGYAQGLSLYFNYRLSNLLQNGPALEPAYPKLPGYVIGITLGGF